MQRLYILHSNDKRATSQIYKGRTMSDDIVFTLQGEYIRIIARDATKRECQRYESGI